MFAIQDGSDVNSVTVYSAVRLQCQMAAMDVYYMTIYGAKCLLCKMAAMYGHYLTKDSNRSLLSQGICFKPADVPSSCKCITLFVTQHLLIMIAMRA